MVDPQGMQVSWLTRSIKGTDEREPDGADLKEPERWTTQQRAVSDVPQLPAAAGCPSSTASVGFASAPGKCPRAPSHEGLRPGEYASPLE